MSSAHSQLACTWLCRPGLLTSWVARDSPWGLAPWSIERSHRGEKRQPLFIQNPKNLGQSQLSSPADWVHAVCCPEVGRPEPGDLRGAVELSARAPLPGPWQPGGCSSSSTYSHSSLSASVEHGAVMQTNKQKLGHTQPLPYRLERDLTCKF